MRRGAIDIAPGVVIQADSNGAGAGGASLNASGAITADATSLILAGTVASAPSDFVKISAGGNLTGQSGDGRNLDHAGRCDPERKRLRLHQRHHRPANIFINASLTSGGTLDPAATGAIDIAKEVTVRGTSRGGRRRHDAGRQTINADPTSLLVAGPRRGPPTSRVRVYADGGNLTPATVHGTNVLIDRRAPKVAPSEPWPAM